LRGEVKGRPVGRLTGKFINGGLSPPGQKRIDGFVGTKGRGKVS